ncbi:glycerol-3-phosphate 1-O-acyltransferase PlsY [Candidatus Poribacteria bacterium]|nr:glycerol-3-phosphate 1-O-acyltransferase PlsY [Candidatus Poribacteria bacterium]
MALAFLALILSYLLGAIPNGYIMGKLKGLDIRKHGSGNIGFTNVLRVMGTLPGAVVLVADVGKGLLSVLLISRLGTIQPNPLSPYMPVLCGGLAMIGHVWPVYLKFRGGKGVASSLGIFFALYWPGGLASLIVWFIIVGITRYVSLGSLLLCLTFLISTFLRGGEYIWGIRIMAIVINIIVIFRHKGNIQRLINGTERKFGKREKPEAA